jgi:pimeloyl-ACP methyl ester carboxylesterase
VRDSITRGLPFVFCCAAALILASCGGGKAASSKPTPTNETKVRPESTATLASPSPAASPTFGPVANEPVAFQTDDGVTVRGHFYASPGPRRKIAVFAHQNGSDQKSWAPLAQEMAARGVAGLTFDFRGFGETGGTRDVAKIDHDLEAAVRFVRSRDYPQIYLVGASMGGTAALKVGARQDVAGVVAVSAPVSFEGLNAEPDVTRVAAPKLLIASRNDPNGAAGALATLLAEATGPKESQLYDGTAHGTELLQGATAAAFRQRLLDFILK